MSAASPRSSKRPPAVGARARELDELRASFKRLFRTLGRLRGRDTHLDGAELSHAQFELLAELGERGELSAGELASAARLTPGSVTQMLESLAASGHVERARSGSDRRVVVSRLTERGAREIERKRNAWLERWQRALAGVSAEELHAARRVLERLDAMLDEDAPAPAAASSASTASERPEAPADTRRDSSGKRDLSGAPSA